MAACLAKWNRFGAAARGDDVFVGIDGKPAEMALLAGEGGTESRCAPSDGVLMMRAANRGGEGIDQDGGRVEIGEALCEVDRLMAVRNVGHLANDRLPCDG